VLRLCVKEVVQVENKPGDSAPVRVRYSSSAFHIDVSLFSRKGPKLWDGPDFIASEDLSWALIYTNFRFYIIYFAPYGLG
jgi:hypothetical protein